MSDLERRSIERIIDKAEELGVEVPDVVRALPAKMCGSGPSHGGLTYVRLHPDVDEYDADLTLCCYGAAMGGITACTCWEPLYDVEQAEPDPAGPRETRAAMCNDCAFRPGSPERETVWHREELFGLADRGEPFYCHDGMRRPRAWRHPQLGEVPGDPDDWQPQIRDGLAYRADGRPALLCAGWAARRAVVTQ